ncbi:MAG: hypothetical protein U9Q82_06900 [Chloroflexota bacterium]|nr:hypothetical protein [Chloroflexota bacterium]
MNIYFACSITGGRRDEAVYQRIVQTLLSEEHQVPTAMLVQSGIISKERAVDPIAVYQRDTDWIKACDTFLSSCSTSSLIATGFGKISFLIFFFSRQRSLTPLHSKPIYPTPTNTNNNDTATIRLYFKLIIIV